MRDLTRFLSEKLRWWRIQKLIRALTNQFSNFKVVTETNCLSMKPRTARCALFTESKPNMGTSLVGRHMNNCMMLAPLTLQCFGFGPIGNWHIRDFEGKIANI